MGFYEVSRREMRHAILKVFPDAEAEQHKGCIGKEALPSHLLWMIEEMEYWDVNSEEEATRATCQIGWMYRGMEELDILTHEECQKLFISDNPQFIKYGERKTTSELRRRNRISTRMTT